VALEDYFVEAVIARHGSKLFAFSVAMDGYWCTVAFECPNYIRVENEVTERHFCLET
jgi:hypothetical protein